MLHCPLCNQFLLEIKLSNSYGVACDRCCFSLPPKQRSKPFSHVQQTEIDAATKSGAYSYFMETLRHG